jgi:phenylpropionate dioxygenase-like ring-hydroxylating dioxygenase large terminal subunit
MTTLFANRAVVTQSWYPAMRSRAVARGGARSFQLGPRRITVYRDVDGRAHALDARCPHLGADLGQGTVDGDALRCAFHGWTFGPDGACRHTPGRDTPSTRRARAYPVQERWGLIWIFNGPTPLFELPFSGEDARWRALLLPRQSIGCHPHLVLANGLDLSHYATVHDMTFTESPRLTVTMPYEVSVEMRGRPRTGWWQFVSGTRRGDLAARFTTVGSSLAWSRVSHPTEFHVLFTCLPDGDGRCITQTIFLFERRLGPSWIRAFALMGMLLHDDRRVLESLDFRPQFADGDEPLRAFAGVVDGLGTW